MLLRISIFFIGIIGGSFEKKPLSRVPTMMDELPWDTWVIALIFCVFKTEFKKSTVIRFKLRCFTPPPPKYNVETLEK